MNEGSALLRQLVKNATDQKREREDMQTCSNENKYVLEQQSNEIMELKEKVRKLEAKIITVRQRKRDYIKLNMALINDKNQTTVEIIRLNAVISRLEKSLDTLVKQSTEQKDKNNFDLIF